MSVTQPQSVADAGTPLLNGGQIIAAHDAVVRGRVLLVTGLGLAACLAFLADAAIGPSSLTLRQILQEIVSPGSLSRPLGVIVWDVRLAYATMAVLSGAALAIAGTEMQTVLNNALASPFTLGVSSAAALGAALAIVLGVALPLVPQNWIVPANAFLFSALAILAVQVLSRLTGEGAETLVLLGIAMMFACNAGVALLQFVASTQALQQLVFWMLGGLTRADWGKIGLLAAVLTATLPFSLRAARPMNALRLGEDRARTFGVDVDRLRAFFLLRVSLLTGTAVAFVGTIAFVGLVAPHLARLIVGEDHRFYLPASALAGALLMSIASVASKLVVPGIVVPVGIVTSLIGVPAFLILIMSARRR